MSDIFVFDWEEKESLCFPSFGPTELSTIYESGSEEDDDCLEHQRFQNETSGSSSLSAFITFVDPTEYSHLMLFNIFSRSRLLGDWSLQFVRQNQEWTCRSKNIKTWEYQFNGSASFEEMNFYVLSNCLEDLQRNSVIEQYALFETRN